MKKGDKMEKFRCWSPPLWKKIMSCGIEPVEVFMNDNNCKTCKVFILDNELKTILTKWTKNRQFVIGGKDAND